MKILFNHGRDYWDNAKGLLLCKGRFTRRTVILKLFHIQFISLGQRAHH